MKPLILLAVVATISSIKADHFTQERKEEYYKFHKDCLAQTGIDEKLVEETRNGQHSEEPKFKDYIFCLSKKIGFQNEAGEFQREFMLKKLHHFLHDPVKVEELVEKCVVQKDSPSESAYQYYVCYYKNSPNHDDVIFYVISISEETHQKLKEYSKECSDQTNVDKNLLDNARRGNFSDDPIFKEFLFCLTQKMGIQNGDGKIQEAAFKEKIKAVTKDHDKMEKLHNLCLMEKDTPMNTALHLLKCYYQHSLINILHIPTLSDKEKKLLTNYHTVCKNESGIDLLTAEKAKKGDFEDSDRMKNHIFCFYKLAGIQNDAGEMDRKLLTEKLTGYYEDSKMLEAMLDKCTMRMDSPQNTAFNALTCFYKNTPNHCNIFKYFE